VDKSTFETEDALKELIRREPIFHRPEWGTTRADFERMTATDFWAIGASGRRYDRRFVLDELERRYAAPHTDDWEATDFECRSLAKNLYLVTYVLLQDGHRRSRRSTIWQRVDDDWQIVFHQGTLVENTNGPS
jgi:hypothetical protein